MEFKEQLKLSLGEKRYNHSIGVSEAALMLAKVYGVNEEKAYTAGLLHDCAKYEDMEEQLKKCMEYGVKLTEIEINVLPVIHAPLGAAVARKEYGIIDEEILNAIRRHTVGGRNMTKLDKVIYLADMIEKNRDFPGVNELRKAAKINLDDAMLLAISESMCFNMKKKTIIHPDTIEAWNDIILNKERE